MELHRDQIPDRRADADRRQALTDKVAELEEQIRQMRQAFAPEIEFPPEWGIGGCMAMVLRGLLARPIFRPDHFEHLTKAKRNGEPRDASRNLKTHIHKLRLFFAPMGITIKNIHGVGFSIGVEHKARLQAMMQPRPIPQGSTQERWNNY